MSRIILVVVVTALFTYTSGVTASKDSVVDRTGKRDSNILRKIYFILKKEYPNAKIYGTYYQSLTEENISRGNLILFSKFPPYLSVRLFEIGDKN